MNKILYFLFLTSVVFAQQDTSFLYQAESFSPPENAIIDNFIGHNAPIFSAPDVTGEITNLASSINKPSVIVFVQNGNELLTVKMKELMHWNEINQHRFQLYFLINTQDNIDEIKSMNNANCKIIPNCAFLGEAVYGSELGTPRIFYLDKSNIIRYVIGKEKLLSVNDVTSILSSISSN